MLMTGYHFYAGDILLDQLIYKKEINSISLPAISTLQVTVLTTPQRDFIFINHNQLV